MVSFTMVAGGKSDEWEQFLDNCAIIYFLFGKFPIVPFFPAGQIAPFVVLFYCHRDTRLEWA